MKLMIASDIHGSAYYARKLMEAFEREGADRLLLLGDLLYHGPRNDLPKEYATQEVYELLNKKKDYILAVRGNCDAEIDQVMFDFPMMADYTTIPVTTTKGEIKVIFATHGHLYGEENPPHLNSGDILLNGHTHIPACNEYENFIYMNPGSVSIPRGESDHGYMSFEQGKFEWKNMDGEVYRTYII